MDLAQSKEETMRDKKLKGKEGWIENLRKVGFPLRGQDACIFQSNTWNRGNYHENSIQGGFRYEFKKKI